MQQQYEKWHSKAKFKQCLDPSPDDLRRVCINLRKAAKGDRLLLHYNGHGVPAPTKNGELWVFFKNYTHYMPVTAVELKSWLGEPAIYVFDCSGAGTLIPHFAEGAIEPGYPSYDTHTNNIQLRDRGDNIHQPSSSSSFDHNTIVLASCRGNEILPLNPQYPADVFTACLTTPIVMAVRWLILQVSIYLYICGSV